MVDLANLVVSVWGLNKAQYQSEEKWHMDSMIWHAWALISHSPANTREVELWYADGIKFTTLGGGLNLGEAEFVLEAGLTGV